MESPAANSEAVALASNHVFVSARRPDEAATLVLRGGRVERLLPRGAASDLAAAGIEVRDLGEAFVTPGFHDAHQHVFHAALFPSGLATEYRGTSERDVVDHMVSFARTRPGDGWLLGHGWRETFWNPAQAPTRSSLDAAFPNRPVALYSGDAHTLWVNSAGLRELGIDEGTEPPQGGSFDRDDEGRLTGVLREAAGMFYVARVLRSLPLDEMKGIYRSYFVRLNAMGVTSVCDMALSLVPGADGINPAVYEALLAEGDLTLRAHLFPTLSEDESNLEGLQARLTGDMLRAPGFKQFFDGVSSQHTAWVTDEYANPRFAGDVGRPTVAPERMRALVLAAASRGHAVRIHTIGDEAVRQAIDIFTEAHRRYGDPHQGANTMEHVEDIHPEDIARMAAAHVAASVQPPHVTIDVTQPARDLGEWRARRMWPFDQMLYQGVTLAFGTDAPVVAPNVLDVLWCATERSDPDAHEPASGWHPEHRVSRIQAIGAYTAGSAAAVARAGELGTLEPGMLADLAIWDTNLLTVPSERLQGSRVLETYVGGCRVWCA
ncbi:amidohydrolase [Olsenella uli]|uniref:amidohydrolase n=1 Tax=Olsenella uli TaxID=133926 RepID=UPI0028EE9413|nr:amidohydrolase [Olsenella uli]